MDINQSSLELLHDHDPNNNNKLSYEIFSILESKFLFGYNDWKHVSPDQNDAVRSVKNQRGKICVLSIDGAGMRNIFAGKALAYLENALKTISGDPNAAICDYFDVAAGTGIGGVFTAMLFSCNGRKRPVYRADDTWQLLTEQGKRLYNTKSKNNSGGLFKRLFKKKQLKKVTASDSVMKEIFTVNGRALTLKDSLKPVLIPCYDLKSSAPFLFSRADALEAESFDFELHEICSATSATPGLFEPVLLTSADGKRSCVGVDGGVAMSNPTAAAITHVLHNKQEFPFVRGVEDVFVLSLGGGQLLEGYGEGVKGWKGGEWCGTMARAAGDASADMVDHAVAMAFGENRGSNYVRIQANGSTMGRCGINVDSDPSPSNIKMLTAMADEMLKQKNVESVLFGGKKITEQTNREKLDWFAGELVLEHQRRSCRIAPTVVLKQASPTSI
ncbi:acyl transferase/acyl hydrolase/lysophospholipase [Artemisia annua]|uniref:Patatin n=1 Tax=Artemisia annua TaxID=35608 RepID=A0A2U1PXS8_ARTAN|nr:acyl transferase/acyl hydrolase/lysophospholipase [Artemisia annua]